jgi:hypothetical protein
MKCLNCGKDIPNNLKYCSLECYRTSIELVKRLTEINRRTAINRKGKTLEEIYGPEKAKYLRETQYKHGVANAHEKFKGKSREEIYGKEKANLIKLKTQNTWSKGKYNDKLEEAQKSLIILPSIEKSQRGCAKGSPSYNAYKIHEEKVNNLYQFFKNKGQKVINLSSWERRSVPDLILIINNKIYGIELEHITEGDSVCARAKKIKMKEDKHKKVGFFDEIKVVFSFDNTDLETLLKQIEIEMT